MKRVPMRWCRSQKPAKLAASAFPAVAGCHPGSKLQCRRMAYSFEKERLLDAIVAETISTGGNTLFVKFTSWQISATRAQRRLFCFHPDWVRRRSLSP